MLIIEPILQFKAKDKVIPSQPATREEEEEKKVVEIFYSEDDFKVLNQPQSLKAFIGDFSHLPSTEVG